MEMSSLFMLIVTEMDISRVMPVIPLMGIDAPCIRNLLFFWIMLRYVASPRMDWIPLGKY